MIIILQKLLLICFQLCDNGDESWLIDDNSDLSLYTNYPIHLNLNKNY